MARDLIAAFLLGGLVIFSFVAGDEFGDEIRRGLSRLYHLVVPARETGTFARRTPRGVETPAAAGGAPGAERAWSSPQAPGAVPATAAAPVDAAGHADRMWQLSEPHLPPRPVNGRTLPDQPRRNKQPWPTAGQPAVRAPEPPAAAWDPGDGLLPPVPLARPYSPEAMTEEARARYLAEHLPDGTIPTPKELLGMIGDLRALSPATEPARPLGLADLGPAGDRSFAERVTTL